MGDIPRLDCRAYFAAICIAEQKNAKKFNTKKHMIYFFKHTPVNTIMIALMKD